MSERAPSKECSLRLIFMGLGGQLSSAPLAVMLQAGVQFCAVVVAASGRETAWREAPPPATGLQSLPLASRSPSLRQLAWENGIPLYETGDLNSQTVADGFRALAPDAVLVSCFARRVPQRLLQLPRHGFLNLHPSLLPAYRGPYPLFWQLRDGLDEIGLTVHRMDAGFDTGPIARQTVVALQDGWRAVEIDQQMGRAGGELFLELLPDLAAGRLSLRPQQGAASAQQRPRQSDFQLDRQWSARRAFNFMRGTDDWARPYTVSDGQQRLALRHALAYEAGAAQSSAIQRGDGVWRIQFNPGVLEAE